jgi:hypothetical protein
MAKSDVWQPLLEKALALKGQSGKLLYQRVTLLKQVYENQAFLMKMRQEGKNPVDEINPVVDDMPWGFDVLLVLLAKFPREKDWGVVSLREMYRVAVEEHKRTAGRRRTSNGAKATGDDNSPPADGNGSQAVEAVNPQASTEDGRERLSWKTKYYELLEKCQDLQRDNKALKKEVADLKEILKARQSVA